VEYDSPGSDATKEQDVPLPWKKSVTTEFGFQSVTAEPTTGALTCRILADDREIIKVGTEGKPVTCKKIVNDD